jgi:hypothetical protein
MVGDGGQEGQAKVADLAPPGPLKDGEGLVRAFQDGAGLGDEHPADSGQPGAAAAAVEQPHPQLALQSGDLLGEGLLGDQ